MLKRQHWTRRTFYLKKNNLKIVTSVHSALTYENIETSGKLVCKAVKLKCASERKK